MAAAQQTPGSEVRTVAGRVLRGTTDGPQPVAGAVVVLHRIASDAAGPVDSLRTARDGSYRFRYRVAGDAQAMYIASVRWAGVAYFTSPLRQREVTGDDADISVFDTTSAGAPLAVRGRHVVLSPPAGATRRVVDVFEISNDTILTRVPGSSPVGTWSVTLPSGATNPSVEQGEISPDAVQFVNGRATVFAPVPPGLKQIVFGYEVPAAQPFVVTLDQSVTLLELLVEGGGVAVEGPLEHQEPVTVSGREFERFLGRELVAGASVRVDLGDPGAAGRLRTLLLAAAGAVALALGIAAGRRGASRAEDVTVATAAPHDPETLARAIAALDAVWEARADTDAARAHWAERRAALKGRLVEALGEVEARGPTQ